MSFRFDRFATLYLVNPLQRRAAGSESVPILMYHSISNDTEREVHPYYRIATSPLQFAAQMKYLRENGYQTASLAEVLSQLHDQNATRNKRIVITFDDGYRDFYTQAFPVLNQYGFTATMFLPTAFIGDSTISFKRKDCLTWAEISELKRYGMLFGSHTVTHPQLRDLSPSTVCEEIANSKTTIEEKLGCAVDSFSYPYAFPQADTNFTKMLRESLRQAGYQAGVCTIVGRANRKSDPLFMERLPVNSCDDDALFGAKLTGAYDWVSKSQYLSKMVNARLRRSTVGAKRRVLKDFPSVQ
jgi:peptidoglycan/xylan/chitin deacetylase (PgdA/CDA1 family)